MTTRKTKPQVRKVQGAGKRKKGTTPHGVLIVHVGEGVTSLKALRTELDEMKDVLFGREDPPIDNGVMTLLEVSTAYYARAAEMTAMIQRAESDGRVIKDSRHYKFRTGELRSFMELAKATMELGSRRVTHAKLEFEQSQTGMG